MTIRESRRQSWAASNGKGRPRGPPQEPTLFPGRWVRVKVNSRADQLGPDPSHPSVATPKGTEGPYIRDKRPAGDTRRAPSIVSPAEPR